MSVYVEIPCPFESVPGRFEVELRFPAASKRRAVQHRHVAWALADVHGVEARTPYKVNRRWSVYEEQWGNGERHGGLDYRGLTVQGAPRALAGYLAALVRVLDAVESLATRAVRVFGAWGRSVAAEVHTEYEDASTMRVRQREFRTDALTAVVGLLGTPVPGGVGRDSSRPLWEQARAVAAEVWAEAGGVDLVEALDDDVAEHLARMGIGAAVVAPGGPPPAVAVVYNSPAAGEAAPGGRAVDWQMELFPQDAAERLYGIAA
ncbi:hypothetical protein [Streptomyces anulatus]|uniref:hypothetical protein n=1 Tax=Streptomyces anulatus TaxID=1892 RepID=UPI0037DCE111|nr:hypothetical protein OHB50_38885 [Streptomyces anulatus]